MSEILVARQVYFPALNGLRAVAVIAVIFYHLDFLNFFKAGYLGVDIFFVLSGFLITSLLLREFEKNGSISLKGFYFRRARRLFPALSLMFLSLMLVASWHSSDLFDQTFRDLLPAVFYFSNWWQIFSNQSYFAMSGRPPLLQHMWSLAIEEQFYFVWPPFILFILRMNQRKILAKLSLSCMLASGGWMIWLSMQLGIPETGDPSRAYLGTDTHAFGLFAGAYLAAIWNPAEPKLSYLEHRGNQFAVDATNVITKKDCIGIVALAMLLVTMVFIDETDPVLYRGGFILFAFIVVIVLYVATQPEGFLPQQLSRPWMLWLGDRSYGLYLWHWPVFALLRPEFELPDNMLLQICIRLSCTIIIADLSYRFFELPILNRSQLVFSKPRLTKYMIIPLMALAVIFAAAQLKSRTQSMIAQKPVELTTEKLHTFETIEASQDKSDEFFPYRNAKIICARSIFDNTLKDGPPNITIIGDSVLLGASEQLLTQIDGVEIDAKVGRQGIDVLHALTDIKSRQALGGIVVLHLGTNGFLMENHVRQMLELLQDQTLVVLINSKTPRRWEIPNNILLGKMQQEFNNVQTLDWHGIGKRHPEYFVSDHIHLTGKGIRVFISKISNLTGVPLITDKMDRRRLHSVACSR